MKRNDLRVGDIVTFRDGDKITIPDQNGLNSFIEHYDYNLKDKNREYHHADIMKVERYVCTPIYANGKRTYTLETIFERIEILDETEKRYLSNVIRPFKHRIRGIQKTTWSGNREYISFDLRDECGFTLATFEAGTMYKGMEKEKRYTPKELGL